ncbi:MAG: hypothetical protein RIN56_00095 [Sporomusaceae bacterium]|nr:hypothetical protein [Sporomusaceae bacterium]
MSYGFINPCHGGADGNKCPKLDQCSDRHAIEGAVYGIHQTGMEKGHKGWGNIELQCSAKQHHLRQAEEAAGEKKQ